VLWPVLHDAVVGAAGAGAVAAQHLRGRPAVRLHQVPLRPDAVQPSMAEMVPEPVRVHRDPGLPPPPGDDLVDAADGQRPPVVPAAIRVASGCKAFDQMAGELKA
jgi:hypothetical protein